MKSEFRVYFGSLRKYLFRVYLRILGHACLQHYTSVVPPGFYIAHAWYWLWEIRLGESEFMHYDFHLRFSWFWERQERVEFNMKTICCVCIHVVIEFTFQGYMWGIMVKSGRTGFSVIVRRLLAKRWMQWLFIFFNLLIFVMICLPSVFWEIVLQEKFKTLHLKKKLKVVIKSSSSWQNLNIEDYFWICLTDNFPSQIMQSQMHRLWSDSYIAHAWYWLWEIRLRESEFMHYDFHLRFSWFWERQERVEFNMKTICCVCIHVVIEFTFQGYMWGIMVKRGRTTRCSTVWETFCTLIFLYDLTSFEEDLSTIKYYFCLNTNDLQIWSSNTVTLTSSFKNLVSQASAPRKDWGIMGND